MERKELIRKKIINMISFFAQNLYLTKTKLMKLLWYADVNHFKDTGRSITGLEYYAWDKGPVPRSLFFEFNNLPEDLNNSIQVISKNKGFQIVSKIKPDLKVFTNREKKILENMVYIFKNCTTEEIVKASHEINKPYDKTKSSIGLNEKIDFLFATDDQSSISKEEAKEKIKEQKELETFFNTI